MSISNPGQQYVCPLPDAQLQGGAARIYPLVVSILYPIYVLLGLVLFILARPSSVFIRKRPLGFIFLSTFGALLGWVLIPLADYLGRDTFPCWVLGLFIYASPAIVMSPLVLKDAKYLSDVAAIRLGKEMAMSRDRLSRQSASSTHLDVDDIDMVDADGSVVNFKAHIQTVFLKNRQKENYVRHVQFTRSRSFTAFWMSMICLPFVLAFVVRVATDARWNHNCYGCNVSRDDAIITLSYFIGGPLVGTLTHRNQVSKRDALYITRETQICWRWGFTAALAMVFYLTDPGNLYKNGYFNYLEMLAMTPLVIIHIQTYHQVYNARAMRQKLLTADNIDRNDRFADVMSNKELKTLFKNHMDNELSSEIYLFMFAVENFKKSFEKYAEEGRLKQAERIMENYVDRRATFEVNLSSKVRERLVDLFTKAKETGLVPLEMFDESYEEVKRHMLMDGFPRFLANVGPQLAAARANNGLLKTNSTKGIGIRTPRSGTNTPRSGNNTPRSVGESPRVGGNTPRVTRLDGTPTTQLSVRFAFPDEDLTIQRDASTSNVGIAPNDTSTIKQQQEQQTEDMV